MTSFPVVLERVGYGSFLNIIQIDHSNKMLIKTSKNEAGHKKLKREIECLCAMEKTAFPIPLLYDIYPTSIRMEYKVGYVELYKVFFTYSPDKKQWIINRIRSLLDTLHSAKVKAVSRSVIETDLYLETIHKLAERMPAIEPIVAKWAHITHVNGRRILDINTIYENLTFISREVIANKIDTMPVDNFSSPYYYSLIHGDCQFNNILINPENDDIVFIDPRGYFGGTSVYGLAEYDWAKLNFALSGYDWFDNKSDCVSPFDQTSASVSINIVCDKALMFMEDELVRILFLCIWFGNAHMFIEDEAKCMESYLIAAYWYSVFGGEG